MMNRNVCLIAVLATMACSDKGDDTGAGDGLGCGVTLESKSSFPVDGETAAYYRTNVEWYLTGADATAVASLSDAAGTAVSGSSEYDSATDTVYFKPSPPLSPSTDYTASLSYCGGNPSISFRTSELGGDVEQTSLEGNTYELDLANARFIKPAGVIELLLSQLQNSILIAITDVVEDTSIKMMGAVSVDGGTAQDYCNPSIDFPEADFTAAPYFKIGPKDTTISAAGVDVTISGLVVSGTIAPDGSYIGGAVLGGELDARALAPVIGELLGEDSGDADYVCELVSGFGVSCEACSSDGAEYCIEVLADSITADLLAGQTLEEVEFTDCHPQCDVVADDCDNSGW